MLYDVILGFILLVGFVNGFKNGLASEIAGLLSLIIGVFVSFRFYAPALAFIPNETVAIMLTFIVVYFVSSIILGFLLTPLIELPTNIGNQMVSGLVGAVEMALFVGVVLYGLQHLPLIRSVLENSVIAGYIRDYAFPLIEILIPVEGRAAI